VRAAHGSTCASVTLTSTPCGAMPLRVRVEQTVRPHAHPFQQDGECPSPRPAGSRAARMSQCNEAIGRHQGLVTRKARTGATAPIGISCNAGQTAWWVPAAGTGPD
jgi:hypothetical protein